MLEPHRSPLGSLALIAIVIGAGAAAFAYTAGWFSPERLTPRRLVAALAPPTGPALGHRRNHAKGICFTGVFEANGAGSELSRAEVFTRGRYPVAGALQPWHPRSERAGRDCPHTGPGDKHLDAGRPRMAQRHDRCPGLCGLDTARFLRAAARLGEQGPERDEEFRCGPSRSSRHSAIGPRTRRGPAVTRKTGSIA